jgi:hypothetical protein
MPLFPFFITQTMHIKSKHTHITSLLCIVKIFWVRLKFIFVKVFPRCIFEKPSFFHTSDLFGTVGLKCNVKMSSKSYRLQCSP